MNRSIALRESKFEKPFLRNVADTMETNQFSFGHVLEGMRSWQNTEVDFIEGF
jgi:hypothetical protein